MQTKQRERYRVLMIAPTSFFADYGCHVRILEEARTLQALGHTVTIVTYRNGKDVPGLDIRRTLPIPWRRDYLVGSSRHKIAFDALLGAKTLALLMRNRYDVIHAHLHEGALIGLVLGRLFGLPVLFDFQGSLTEEMVDHQFLDRDSSVYRPLRRLENWIDQSSQAIFTSSANAQQILLEQFQCKPERVHVLPDCVNADVFKPADKFDPDDLRLLRQQLGIPQEAQLIVYVGLLAAYQGTDHLLQAMQRICNEQSNVYLLLMGFPNLTYYQDLARNLGILERVIFTGGVPYSQLPPYLALGDVAVAPKLSLTEGCGKLLNYMAMALPTVAFDTPVAREYLGANGLLAIYDSTESLAQCITQALSPVNAERYRQMGTRLRQRALQKFSWRQAGMQISETYRQLIDPTAAKELGDSNVLHSRITR